MPLTTSEENLVWVRERIGITPDDDTLDEIYDQPGIGSREAVARFILSQRLQAVLSQPAQFSIPGDYEQQWTAQQISAMQKALDGIPSIAEEAGADVVVFVNPAVAIR